uniref:ATP synthase F0 subunit 8 n=1 Tax=Psilochorema bidens TaxID=1968986 RepID=UPI0028D36D52|nr:ATP synthase F0 subunit 8 [Psilochorema bidens]WMQ76554.1 ATP synthase F0 subunit 8 [Psilochorema bidens]
MPQMMPLNWINLFIWFIIMFMLFNIFNFYLFNQPKMTSLSNQSTKLLKFNWKW